MTLRRRGFVRGQGETLQMLSQRLVDASDPCAPPFAKLVELYYAHRFGDLPLDRVEVSRLLREIVTLAKQHPPRASSLPS